MRTLKKALCLVLVLAMVFTLAVPALAVDKASEYKDYSKVTNTEAVDVLTAIGVLSGNDDGTFGPTGNFTRAQAATIIAHMMLGSSASALLPAATGFSDVPATHWASGYIQYCVQQGIINGYGDGKFGPDDTLTATQWSLMLLGALGYKAANEGIGGTGWEISATSLAIQAGVASAEELTATFNRDMAAQLAFNALKAPLVYYTNNGGSISINGAQVTLGASAAQYVTTTVANEQTIYKNRLSNTSNQYTVEFGERYFPTLKLSADTDAFGRPSRTWTYDKKDIGTYADTDKLVAEYTTTVKGGTIYSAIGSEAAKFDLTCYVDGKAMTTAETKAVAALLVKNGGKLVDSSGNAITGNGVLTQVFVDNDKEETTIVVINTYLAKVTTAYSAKSESSKIAVYNGINAQKTTSVGKTVKLENVANVADFAKDDFVLVTMANGVVETMAAPATVSDVTISSYSTDGTTSQTGDRMTKVTADGTKYEAAENSYYDATYLVNYKLTQLDNNTYNLYLDPYGYVVGLEAVDATVNYVFIAGYKINSDVLSSVNDQATAIFTDGTMKTIDVKASSEVKAAVSLDDSTAALNTWFKYTMDGDVYVLSTVDQIKDTSTTTINSEYPTLSEENTNKFGNDKTVYITVNTDTDVSRITSVDTVTTGIKNTNISVTAPANKKIGGTFALYKNGYVTYAVVIGEDASSTNNLVYVTSNVVDKTYVNKDTGYVYTYNAIVKGEATQIQVKASVADNVTVNNLYKMTYDATGFVKAVTAIEKVSYDNLSTSYLKKEGKIVLDSGTAYYGITGDQDGTLYINDQKANQRFVLLDDDCVFFVKNSATGGNQKWEEFSDLDSALAETGNANKITGRITVIADKTTGYATTVIIYDTVFEADEEESTQNPEAAAKLDTITYADKNLTVTLTDNAAEDTEYVVTLSMVNGGTTVDLGTYTVTVKDGDKSAEISVGSLAEGSQYKVTCGDWFTFITA